MKQQKILAERYAKALFSLGQEAHQIDEIKQQLEQFQTMCAENAELDRVFSNPLFPLLARQTVISDLGKKLHWHAHTIHFLLLLLEKGRTSLLPDILQAYTTHLDHHHHRLHVYITSATALSQEYLQRLTTQLHQQTKQEILLHIEESPSLIGGVVIKMGDKMLDGSLSSQLGIMKEQLLQQVRQS